MVQELEIEDVCALTCPSCGGIELHQEAVEVIFRDGIEEGDGTRTVCARGAPTVARVADADIKETRRDLMRISFTCEDCSKGTSTALRPAHRTSSQSPRHTGPDGEDDPTKIFKLLIVQHKGRTHISWE